MMASHHRNPFHVQGDDSPPPPRAALKKGPWSAAEDAILMDYVRKHGEGNWNAVQRNTSLQRCGKSCRLRWANHLRPNLKKGAFSPDEERLIIDLHAKLGNKWARISAHLPGRTDNEVKNYWNTRVKRRLRQGLPLYPHNQPPPPVLSSNPPPHPPPILPLPPPLPLSLSHLKNPPLFDPISFPFPSTFFSFQQPSVLSPATRRYNCFPSPAASIRDSLLAQCIKPFGFDSHQTVPNLIETEPLDPFNLGFEHKLELPSNEFCPKLASDDDDAIDCDFEAIDGARFIPNIESRSNSGLLDALLHEAQFRAAAADHSKKKKDEEHEDQWDLSSANSASGKGGANMEEADDHTYCMNEDLSSILNLIPSPATLPKHHKHEPEKEISDSAADNNNMALDLPQLPHILANSEWLNSVPYATWDNLPRIC